VFVSPIHFSKKIVETRVRNGIGKSAVLNMIWFPDHDPTGFCNSEPDRIRLDFEKHSTGSDMDIQTALITAVKCLIRVFFRI